MALDDKDRLIAQQEANLDDLGARMAAAEASENYWRKTAREYRASATAARREMWELQAVATQMAPVSDSALAAGTLLASIHAVLIQDRSDRVIDNIVLMIEDHWRVTGQLRP